ncbi:MAG: phosphoenolpyruvate--protein phosphotransferase [candidate division Zixibacteria bacterium]|nr:phosphoenolpyruvate--protein phosphotransferase [candidate division Zixibacteria bacterium]
MTSGKKSIMLKGIPASPGIIVGRAVVLKRDKIEIKPSPITAAKIPKEIADFKRAISIVKNNLQKTAAAVGKRLGQDHARIFEAQAMIADDIIINLKVIELIKEKQLSAAYLYYQQVDEVVTKLSQSSDEYLKERILDINSVCTRLLSVLQGAKKSVVKDVEGPTIVIAGNLAPGDLLAFSVRKKIGFAMEVGGVTSHTCLLAKSMNLPAIVGLGSKINRINSDDMLILDGFSGKLYINPKQNILKSYRRRLKFLTDLKKQLSRLKSKPAVTTDGHRIKILNNAELPAETSKVIKSGAEGIGLYRTEYFFLAGATFPSLDKQFRVYKSILEKMGDNPVIIRTFDLGGDKFAGNAAQAVDSNPFLGWRAIRFCLDNPDIFKTQLKALLKASMYGNLEIMLPMISNLDELLKAKKLIRECEKELTQQKIRFKENVPLGVMIEVPSAVIMAEHLAAEADFFSLGTNDLTQYVLAVDRTNQKLTRLYQSLNPAVLKMIQQTITVGHDKGIRVGICGELASDPYGVILLVGFGVDELSANYSSTGLVKQIVRNIDKKRAAEIAEKACQKKTVSQVENLIKNKIKAYFPDLIPLINFIRGANHV